MLNICVQLKCQTESSVRLW